MPILKRATSLHWVYSRKVTSIASAREPLKNFLAGGGCGEAEEGREARERGEGSREAEDTVTRGASPELGEWGGGILASILLL